MLTRRNGDEDLCESECEIALSSVKFAKQTRWAPGGCETWRATSTMAPSRTSTAKRPSAGHRMPGDAGCADESRETGGGIRDRIIDSALIMAAARSVVMVVPRTAAKIELMTLLR
jgi:hypothetical protein